MHAEGLRRPMKHKEFDRISGNILFYISWNEVFQTLTEAHNTFCIEKECEWILWGKVDNESELHEELHEWLFWPKVWYGGQKESGRSGLSQSKRRFWPMYRPLAHVTWPNSSGIWKSALGQNTPLQHSTILFVTGFEITCLTRTVNI